MSVLSRPVRHHITAPTQREVQIPLPRTSQPDAPTLRTRPQTTRPAPPADRRTRMITVIGGGLAVAAALGVGAYALFEDDGAGTVIAPAVVNVPSASDLARDRAAAARGPAGAALPAATVVTEAERQAALAQRLQNSGNEVTLSTISSDAVRLSEAQRDAALARRVQNITP